MAVPSPTVTIVPASLYVGDLHPDVSEGQIFELFSEFKSLASVRVCRDTSTGKSLCYGYVNFVSPQDAIRAIELKNHAILNGKAIRVMWSRRDPGARKNNSANVFVKNGKSKGYGFVQFESEESANAAIEKLNGSTVGDKQIYVDRFVKKSDCVLPGSEARYTNLYMKNLDLDITEAVLQEKFSSFGKIVSLAIAKDNKGVSKGFGFVNYDNADDAKRTLEAMNGTQFGSKIIYVARAQKKSERQQILTNQFEEKRKEKIIKYEGSNIYVKNIDDNVSDEELRDQFSSCGTITSAKIMRNSKGISKGFGFVCFSTPEEANIAVNNFHGFMFHGKPLYVALAQRKEDRQAYLQLQYAQKIAGPSTAATPGGYPPLYYAAAGVTSQVPLGAGLVYQSRALRPGWRANAYASPARSFQQSPVPVLTGQAKYVTSGHHGKMVKGSEFTSGASNYSGGSQGSEMLYTMLSAAAPNQQKQILGEHLYELPRGLEAKITGMLLEMNNAELLVLLEAPESLSVKVEEAMKVLHNSKTKVSGQDIILHSKYLSAEVAVN
ncbi:hypothetical protein TanjilG_30821 [Lupinus angustifolius]|uniref:PABP n=1 Tax=Lupinus angustifolius TaxID=3871 RepID=A0A1J7GRC2_LUPAN|nr:hypothetical protein TanjilG_30821 [Lupinus angustifolius]